MKSSRSSFDERDSAYPLLVSTCTRGEGEAALAMSRVRESAAAAQVALRLRVSVRRQASAVPLKSSPLLRLHAPRRAP